MVSCRGQIKDARPLIEDMEIEKRLDMAQVTRDAIKAVEETGIVFIDEIDKVRGHAGKPRQSFRRHARYVVARSGKLGALSLQLTG